MPDHNKPIFLHGLWRTGTTYFWHKFKHSNAQLRCFFEPFHHSLYKNHQDLCLDYDRASHRFDLKFVHDNYYDEYEAGKNGVNGYDWRFATDNYHINSIEARLPITRYINSLCQLAQVNQQRPILQFNRAILRANWLNKRFNATSLYILRSPQDSLQSYQRLSKGRSLNYYMSCYLGIIGCNSSNPLFSSLAAYLGVKYKKSQTFSGHLKYYAKAFNQLSNQQRTDLFLFFWTLGLLEATKYALEIIDTSLVTQQSQLQSGWYFQHILKNTTGIHLDLTDLNVKVTNTVFPKPSSHLKAIITQAINRLNPNLEILNRWKLSNQTLEQLYEITDITTGQFADTTGQSISVLGSLPLPFTPLNTGTTRLIDTERIQIQCQ